MVGLDMLRNLEEQPIFLGTWKDHPVALQQKQKLNTNITHVSGGIFPEWYPLAPLMRYFTPLHCQFYEK